MAPCTQTSREWESDPARGGSPLFSLHPLLILPTRNSAGWNGSARRQSSERQRAWPHAQGGSSLWAPPFPQRLETGAPFMAWFSPPPPVSPALGTRAFPAGHVKGEGEPLAAAPGRNGHNSPGARNLHSSCSLISLPSGTASRPGA